MFSEMRVLSLASTTLNVTLPFRAIKNTKVSISRIDLAVRSSANLAYAIAYAKAYATLRTCSENNTVFFCKIGF